MRKNSDVATRLHNTINLLISGGTDIMNFTIGSFHLVWLISWSLLHFQLQCVYSLHGELLYCVPLMFLFFSQAEEMLTELTSYLRGTYLYCVWCGTRFDGQFCNIALASNFHKFKIHHCPRSYFIMLASSHLGLFRLSSILQHGLYNVHRARLAFCNIVFDLHFRQSWYRSQLPRKHSASARMTTKVNILMI